MELNIFAPIINATMTDTMDIYHYLLKENPDDRTAENILPATPSASNLACRLSFKQLENPQDNYIDNVPVKNILKIFCSLQTDIRAGDFIVVRRTFQNGSLAATYKGTAGLPSVLPTHKEVAFSIEESA